MENILREQDADALVTGIEEYLDVIYKGYKFLLENGIFTLSEKYNSEPIEKVTDKNPGDISTDKNGNPVSGTASSPYQICSIEDLIAFADLVDNGAITTTDTVVALEETLYFKSPNSYVDSTRTSLTTYALDGTTELETHTYSSNILSSMTTRSGWKPIGMADGFYGTLDGNGKELKGLYINYIEETDNYVGIGLFAYNYGIIKNLEISGIVCGTMRTTYEEAGTDELDIDIASITGDNYGTIDNCLSKTRIIVTEAGEYEKEIYAGGLAGYSNGKIINSTNEGSITVKANNQPYLYMHADVAGISGYTSGGEVLNCINTGEIYVDNIYSAHSAGITGVQKQTIIKKCYNTGKINNTNIVNWIETGGISGRSLIQNESGELTNCYNLGMISVSGGNTNGALKGGITGYEGYFESITNNYDGTGIGAIGGQDFIGMAESVSGLTVESITSYINRDTHPTTESRTYASTGNIVDVLKPGSYVEYDTSSLPDYQIPQSLAGTCSHTDSQLVTPSSYEGGWQVLSNDGINVEIISSDLVNITNSYSNTTQWLYLQGETGYKKAVSALNTASEAFINSTYANSARSVGSTSNSKPTITDTLKYKPTNYSNLTDLEFYKDFANMCYSGTVTATSGEWYWLASRYCWCYCDPDYVDFKIRVAKETGKDYTEDYMFSLNPVGEDYSSCRNNGLRPVVSLKSTLKVTGGTGTESAPYILGI